MDLSNYRRDFAAYCSAIERERSSHHAGLTREPHFAPIEERCADLWTRESIQSLHTLREETTPHFETERAALHSLISAARLKNVEQSAREVSGELARCSASSQVSWAGARITSEEARERVGSESDVARRHELAARWYDAVSACDDLRAARLESLQEAARSLGFRNLRALDEDVAGVELEKLAVPAQVFLERTADVFRSHLSRWVASAIPTSTPTGVDFADSLHFERAAHLDDFFPAGTLRVAYRESFGALGIRVETQRNIRLDDEARPLKKSWPSCFAVNPPDEVHLVWDVQRGGANLYRQFFHQAGRAQHFGWSSRDAAARYPELVHAPEGSVRAGQAALFSGLLRDAAWLGELRALRATEAQEAARFLALRELYETRRDCARLLYWLELSEAQDARSEHLAQSYGALYSEATGFQRQRSLGLADLDEVRGAPESLRARLFAESLREHLRARYGRRWYAARAAGDELIDMWNTASRYRAEEMAQLVWGGSLDFELLADALTAALDA